MNRGPFYRMAVGGALTLGVLAGTPICRPTFGNFLQANQDQEKREKEIVAIMKGEVVDHHHHDDKHHGGKHHDGAKAKGHH
ncbi:hypothetical protein DICPUDRAFT_159107 [Dictyostelium purpureum]|uniref:Uncharacterized protein n=1 Tax=Dictyostelium purpureum TaxID=5786 RepID=F1A3B1_DICPU|nr:uncharacterized protein DICPUDRAFT_159107 [Dictyostelium purpureum]EGC29319.1 hypothetical protein DICPUDRAFT_159107 [Dictyostelium purpureum]|eukprot:XP_003294151.1 hypothetical protein DICPUDRAFT_159107 [Dictyostelium purpureum]